MDEGIKQMELEDIHHLIKHEIQAVIQYELLDNKAKEGQWFQEGALRAEKHSPTRKTPALPQITKTPAPPAPSDKSKPFLNLPLPV